MPNQVVLVYLLREGRSHHKVGCTMVAERRRTNAIATLGQLPQHHEPRHKARRSNGKSMPIYPSMSAESLLVEVTMIYKIADYRKKDGLSYGATL